MGFFVVLGGRKKDKDSKRRLTKADIGLPKDFRHVSHVGWDPNKGFDLDNVEDPQLKLFFDKVYILYFSNKHLLYKMGWKSCFIFMGNRQEPVSIRF